MEEQVTLDFNYQEICTLLDSGTVKRGSLLYDKLRRARDAFRKEPKIYGNGYGMRMKDKQV